jgi:solute carrier family 25 (mitochondrial folate transporter), member 32
MIASAIAKAAASVVAYPHEVLRARFQYQLKSDSSHYTSLREACHRIHLEEGIRGFYKGLTANLCRVVPSSAVTFLVYEFVVNHLYNKL